ncbi:50S ribosomal protein L31 [Wolbachia endosymbiont of Cruorifilaria tuberocauda]|uniref:50S ribosomal protein L31 n=1 Tax=Wolbachia endosymbiont of Cruorifilaria tuberocauda TaxID=1812111 RepID=UPI001589E640|nr:50S ribosomal protein L31 [Wolbachia endosymbiont of Cruorifilaria tuberocauda]QKX01483.1 50S ribosomal protein L31 [Wolbachia endosymbiont of Cruorifilaria tuberocauda]
MIKVDYHKITIIMTNGQEFETYSTYGKEGDKIRLDRDPLTHPAWTGSLTGESASRTSKLAKFNDRYGNIF